MAQREKRRGLTLMLIDAGSSEKESGEGMLSINTHIYKRAKNNKKALRITHICIDIVCTQNLPPSVS